AMRSAAGLVGGPFPAGVATMPSVPPQENVPGWQFADPLENRSIPGRVEEREIVIERVQVDVELHLRRAQQRFDLRSEVQASARFGVVDRLDADAIACEQQRV